MASPTAGLVGPDDSVAFGDGTLEDFAFFQQPTGPDGGTGVPTAFATAGTNNITINALPAGSFNESSTGSFAQINDQAGNSFSSNIVLGSDVSGTIDTSSFDSGTVYLAFGTF